MNDSEIGEHIAKMKSLRLHPICDQMEDSDYERLLGSGKFTTFRPLDFISRPGRPAPAVYIIIKGSVLVSRSPTWEPGRSIYIARRKAGILVGELSGRSLFHHSSDDPFANPNFAFTGATTAETDCEMLQIPHETFNEMLRQGGIFAVNVVRCMALKVLEASERMEFLKHRSAASRIAAELLHLLENHKGVNPVQIPMRMRDFAAWLDIEAATLSRTLKKMEKVGLIEYHTSRSSNGDDEQSIGKNRLATVNILDETRLIYLRDHDRDLSTE